MATVGNPRAWILAALCVALAGCGSDAGSERPTSSDSPSSAGATGAHALDGLTYTSTSVTGRDLVDGSAITLDFDGDIMAVSTGCNTQFAAFELSDAMLRWTEAPASTMKSCPPEAEEQDAWLAEIFERGVAASSSGPVLTLVLADVTIVLAAEPGTDLNTLLGRTWTVVGTIAYGSTARLPARTQRPHVVVGKNGLARLGTGCNTGRTVVRVDGDTFVFGPSTATRVACRQPDREIQRRVLAVLDGPADAVLLDHSVLVVVNGDLGLVFQVV